MSNVESLFGSESDASEDEQKSSNGDAEELPSTQSQMKDLFGDSDDSKDRSDDSDDNAKGQEEKQEDPELNFDNIMEDNQENVEQTRNESDDESDLGQNNSAVPTTQDLFGEEVSSDDDNQDEKARSPSPRRDELEEESHKPSQKEENEEEDDGLSISIELPRCNISLGKELYFVKLPNFLSVDTKPFDPNFYDDVSSDEDEILDEEGRQRLKLKVENTIRWRYAKDKDGEEIKESNCRFVRWSDGSLSMHLGNEVFDVFKMKVEGEQNHLFVQQGTGLQAQAVFKNKLSFRPHSTASQTHRKMTMSIADRMAKAQKVKIMPATERDPESQRVSAMKKEDERLRAVNRRESQQRRMREKNHLKGLSSGYLNDDDDDGYENSIAAIKADVKNKKRKPIDIYGDEDEDEYEEDDESENEDKLRSAKLDVDSDDDDELDAEIRVKREELARKKKSSRKKIISDDEDESD